jgi:hypothetical protein
MPPAAGGDPAIRDLDETSRPGRGATTVADPVDVGRMCVVTVNAMGLRVACREPKPSCVGVPTTTARQKQYRGEGGRRWTKHPLAITLCLPFDDLLRFLSLPYRQGCA